METPTKEEAIKGLDNPLVESLEKQGISADYLTQKLKEELEAHETKVFSGPKGIIYSKDMIAWQVRQKARQDAHRLRGDYPNENLTLTHNFTEHTKQLLEKIDGESRKTLPSEEEED